MEAILSAPSLLFVLTFAFVCYVLGSTFVEGLINYRSWRYVGPKEFKTYHQGLGPRVIACLDDGTTHRLASREEEESRGPRVCGIWRSLWLAL